MNSGRALPFFVRSATAGRVHERRRKKRVLGSDVFLEFYKLQVVIRRDVQIYTIETFYYKNLEFFLPKLIMLRISPMRMNCWDMTIIFASSVLGPKSP